MGCGSSSTSSTGQPPSSAPTAATQRGGRPPTKSTSVGIVANSNSNNSNNNGGRRRMGSGRGDGILPADIGSPPPGGSHRASRVSIGGGGGGGGGGSGISEASAVATAAQQATSSSRSSRQSVRTPTTAQPLPPSSPPLSTPQPTPAPTKAAEEDASVDPSWRDDLLGELNRQRRQVFSPDLGSLNLRSELCAVARREAQRLADQRVTVVSPAIDEEALARFKAGVRCHVMSRVLTKEESLDLRLYLAGLMAGMKAKEEDLVDRDQLQDSDAAFWTLNGSFGCALVNFDVQSEGESSTEQDMVQEEFAVLTMVFCPESCLDTITAAAGDEQEDGGQRMQVDRLQKHRSQNQKETAGDDAASAGGQGDSTPPESEAAVVAAAAAEAEAKEIAVPEVAEKATAETEAAAAEAAEAAAAAAPDNTQETTVEAESQLADAEKTAEDTAAPMANNEVDEGSN